MRRCQVWSTPAVLAFLLSMAVSAPFAADAAAQTAATSRVDSILSFAIGGRFNAQYQASSVSGSVDDFIVRRARLTAEVGFTDFIDLRLQTEFAGNAAVVLDAYARFDFEPLDLYVGQFKRSFDLFGLSSASDLSLIERDGRVEGYVACTGVGSLCSFSRLSEALGYSGRDTGLKIQGAAGRFLYQASLTNGTGVRIRDVNEGKSAAARLGYRVTDNVVVTGNVGMRDYLVAGSTENAVAWTADVQVGDWRDGLLLQAAVAAGDNWMPLTPSADPPTFLTAQAVLSYYRPLQGSRIVGVEPLARFSIADPDDVVDDDGGVLLTPGVMFYFSPKNKVGMNLDYYLPQTGGEVYSIKFQTYLYF